MMHLRNLVIAYGRDFDEYSTIFSSNQAVKPKAFGCFVVAASSSGWGWGTTRAEPLKPRRVEAAETGLRPSVKLRGLPMDSRCPRPERLDVLLPPAIFVRAALVARRACLRCVFAVLRLPCGVLCCPSSRCVNRAVSFVERRCNSGSLPLGCPSPPLGCPRAGSGRTARRGAVVRHFW